MPLSPVTLTPNQPPRPYLGGEGIARLRGVPTQDEFRPEDFVGSATTTFGDDRTGLSTLPDGRLLRDAIAADPIGFLGAEHLARFGPQPELLVKLLDTAQRLFVHAHPDDAFAAQHLGVAHGKTEAWVVVATRETNDPHGAGNVHLGFHRPVSEVELRSWVAGQHIEDMLDAMHRLEVGAGDTVLVPAGAPHSIGAGITVVEVQQPSDLSILMELDGFPRVDRAGAFLGLTPETALGAVDRSALDAAAVGRLVAAAAARPGGHGVRPVLPDGADPFFRVDLVESTAEAGPLQLDPGYSVVVVLDGAGRLAGEAGSIDLARGATVLLPHGTGPLTVEGTLTALRCRPPAA